MFRKLFLRVFINNRIIYKEKKMIDISKMANDIMAYEEKKRKAMYEQAMNAIPKVELPTISLGDDISELLANSKEQNRLLTEQNRLLQEENERQKQQLIDSQKEKELAKKSARNSKIFAWFSLGLSILIGVLGLIL